MKKKKAAAKNTRVKRGPSIRLNEFQSNRVRSIAIDPAPEPCQESSDEFEATVVGLIILGIAALVFYHLLSRHLNP